MIRNLRIIIFIGYLIESGSINAQLNKTVEVAIIKVGISPTAMTTVESKNSGEFEVKVKPANLTIQSYQWLTDGAWPAGAGNSPALNYSNSTSNKTSVNTTIWFAKTNNRRQLVDGPTCQYVINCEVTIDGQKIRSAEPSQLNVNVNIEGETSRAQMVEVESIVISESDGTFRVTGKGNFRRKAAVVKYIGVPSTSQFYNKLKAHEQKHVHQWTSETPWKDLFDADALYSTTLSKLTSTKSEGDLLKKIWVAFDAKENADQTKADNTKCDREKAAFEVERSTEPHFLEADDADWMPAYGCP